MIAQVVTAVSAVTAIAPKLATYFGLTSSDAISHAVTATFGIIAILAPIYGSIKRARSTAQPLTLTQAAADSHPATVANAVAAAVPARMVSKAPTTPRTP